MIKFTVFSLKKNYFISVALDSDLLKVKSLQKIPMYLNICDYLNFRHLLKQEKKQEHLVFKSEIITTCTSVVFSVRKMFVLQIRNTNTSYQ